MHGDESMRTLASKQLSEGSKIPRKDKSMMVIQEACCWNSGRRLLFPWHVLLFSLPTKSQISTVRALNTQHQELCKSSRVCKLQMRCCPSQYGAMGLCLQAFATQFRNPPASPPQKRRKEDYQRTVPSSSLYCSDMRYP